MLTKLSLWGIYFASYLVDYMLILVILVCKRIAFCQKNSVLFWKGADLFVWGILLVFIALSITIINRIKNIKMNSRVKMIPEKNITHEMTGYLLAQVEAALKAGEIKEMRSFPRGCCSYASDLLQRYLVEQHEFFTWYMSGKYGYGEDGESHAWLETYDHSVAIDITGDQYKYKKLRFTERVYVGTRFDGFHDQFQLHEPVEYYRIEDPFGSRTRE